jgi:hypothetical protein
MPHMHAGVLHLLVACMFAGGRLPVPSIPLSGTTTLMTPATMSLTGAYIAQTSIAQPKAAQCLLLSNARDRQVRTQCTTDWYQSSSVQGLQEPCKKREPYNIMSSPNRTAGRIELRTAGGLMLLRLRARRTSCGTGC